MHVDGVIGFDPSGVIESARLAERVGYDGMWSAETTHDPFLPWSWRPSTPSGSRSVPASPWPSPATR